MRSQLKSLYHLYLQNVTKELTKLTKKGNARKFVAIFKVSMQVHEINL